METTERAGKVRFLDVLKALPGGAADTPKLVKGAAGLLTVNATTKRTIGSVFQALAHKQPERPFLRFDDRVISYGEANAQVNRYASVLADNGVGEGKVVGILAQNRPETLLVALAVVKLGAVAGMFNYNQRGEVLNHSQKLLGATVIVAGAECEEALSSVAENQWQGKIIGLANEGAKLPGNDDLDELAAAASDKDPAITDDLEAKTKAFYIFTSGTTGLPKASTMSHMRWLKSMYGIGGLGVRLEKTDVLYCCLPLYHNNALTVSLSSVLAAGASMAIGRKFSASKFWDDVVRMKATAFCYIGELCRYLLNQPVREAEKKQDIKVIVGNGLRPEIWNEFKDRFGIERIAEFYGASECNLAFINGLNLDRTAGMSPLPYAVVEYDQAAEAPKRGADGRLQRVKVGDVGLLITKVTDRAPFDGYTDPEATEKKLLRDGFKDGDCWFNTGDLVLKQGFFHVAFADRLGDTFRWKGENVATTEVEGALGDYEGVEQAVVFGVSVPGTDGKAGMAALKLEPGASFDGAALAAYLSKELPSYAVPLFIRLIDQVEQTSTFKSRKVDLRDEGYDSSKVSDPLYVLSGTADGYVKAYDSYAADVASGKVRV